jgi:hypothetical protein
METISQDDVVTPTEKEQYHILNIRHVGGGLTSLFHALTSCI